jgi:hypothetical protein
MYCKLICILYALLCWQNFILVKSGCYMLGKSQCLDGALNDYRERCAYWIRKLDTFYIEHVHRDRNKAANYLGNRPHDMKCARAVQREQKPVSCYTVVMDIGRHKSAEEGDERGMVPEDWRHSINRYIQEPGSVADRKVRCQSLKYTMIGEDLYRRTVDGLLLKCLDEEHAKIAMVEVHEGICETHQWAPKMKWMLKRVGFFLASYEGGLSQVLQGLRSLPMVWGYSDGTGEHIAPHHQSMAISWLGFRFHR